MPDLTVDPDAAKYEKTATVQVLFAEQDGEMDTLEGRVPYLKGDALLRGVMGEGWPVKRHVFKSLYEPVKGKPAIYRKKLGSTVYAKQMDIDFQVKIQDGSATLVGRPGDWLVQYSKGEVGVVANDIFFKSYRPIG